MRSMRCGWKEKFLFSPKTIFPSRKNAEFHVRKYTTQKNFSKLILLCVKRVDEVLLLTKFRVRYTFNPYDTIPDI